MFFNLYFLSATHCPIKH